MTARPSELTVEDYVRGVAAGDTGILSRAITLVESTRPEHARMAREVLQALLPRTGSAVRVGVSGVPGAGKSTFIDALGSRLTAAGHRVAVLAVDPSSSVTGGSILGDKTRMERLSRDPAAYVRPSPAGGSLGGVARRTREASLLCEAAGYDVILIETVGVGQSETAVANMVDTFVLLVLPGAGDELQGIKRGITELADVIVVHKADGDNVAAAQQARAEYESAQRVLRSGDEARVPAVITASSLTGEGLDTVWQAILAHRAALGEEGLAARRRRQAEYWFEQAIAEGLRAAFDADPRIVQALPALRARVASGEIDPTAAADELLRLRS